MDTFLLERCPFASSRGSFIITQKENKGEYSSGWEWNNATYDYDIYAHTVDQNGPNGSNDTPYRYLSATSLGNNVCTSDTRITHGSTAYSSISEQVSCNPNTLNAGNWYNFPAATAGSKTGSGVSYPYDTKNSICPKGWQLPPNADNKSYNTLIRTAYGLTATGSDSTLLNNFAMSFVHLGYYNYSRGSLNDRGGYGGYWSSTAYNDTNGRYLVFQSSGFNPQYGIDRAFGFPIRCVSRDSR